MARDESAEWTRDGVDFGEVTFEELEAFCTMVKRQYDEWAAEYEAQQAAAAEEEEEESRREEAERRERRQKQIEMVEGQKAAAERRAKREEARLLRANDEA